MCVSEHLRCGLRLGHVGKMLSLETPPWVTESTVLRRIGIKFAAQNVIDVSSLALSYVTKSKSQLLVTQWLGIC